MDIFGRKKIQELEETIRNLESENTTLKADLNRAYSDIVELTQFKSTTSIDCTPGEYCKACEFGKDYLYKVHLRWTTAYRCSKAESCVNFIQKKEVD